MKARVDAVRRAARAQMRDRVENPRMTPEGDLEARIARETAHLAELDRQRAAVTARLTALRAQLPPAEADATSLTAGQKVALFRRLFAGRPDIYAVRWENTRSGRAGMS